MKYSAKVLDHFQNPRNQGKIENPDATGLVGNPVCGDIMKIYLKIAKNEQGEDYIQDIKFETLGCAAAIATSSMLTELAKGKTLKEAEKITFQDIAHELGWLPEVKLHCSNLAARALKKAIENYRQKYE